ncbi:oxidoreductase [Roridomyces roridus]|uniref:Oxidoreductase n=1 Tax=Roridomyces roridus TaxID=1738132 RepID=A0AAD7BT92_9AGAR|nr:oxidoreductase [Roridomyces roridus]
MVFNPTTDIPDLAGKYILVTGGTAGIGKESVLALAKHNPECIYFTGRDSKRADEIIAETKPSKVVFLECDMTSLASVQAMAQRVISETDRLDVLMCNAGVMNVPPALTKDGFEVHFGINHMAHALLIKLLLPTLLHTAEAPGSDVRIVSLTSQASLHIQEEGSGIIQAQRYGQSKLANLLYAAELARRYPQITSVSIHPGVVRTGLVSSQGMFSKALIYITNPLSTMTPADGARNQLWAATTDKQSIVNGEYYEPVGKRGKHMRKSRDVGLAEKLWDWTQSELDGF